MIRAIRYPERLSTFGLFILLQVLLFIPASIIFTFRGDAHTFAVGSIAVNNSFIAAAVTLAAVIAYLVLTRDETPSFVIPLSFAVFYALLAAVFTVIVLGRSYDNMPYEWDKYPRIVFRMYSAPITVLTFIIVSGIKICKRTRGKE